MNHLIISALACVPLLAACAGPRHVPAHDNPVAGVRAPPAGLAGLDYGYYRKYASASGVHIVASADVDDKAILKMKLIVETMLSKDEATRKQVAARLHRILIIPKGKGMTTLPEYVNLDRLFPLDGGMTWNARTQGIAWTEFIPYTSCSEANLLRSPYPQDRYPDESICVHEMAHTMWEAGVVFRDDGAQARLESAYAAAKARGLLGASYAGNTSAEYWAEGVQGWFDAATCRNTPTCRHAMLQAMDPALYQEVGRWNVAPERMATPL